MIRMRALACFIPFASLLAACTAGPTSLGEPVGTTGSPGTTSHDDHASSGGTGSSDDSGSSDSTDDDGGEPGGCVPDGECPVLDLSCDALEGDFSCRCSCHCDDENPMAPGNWACDYTRYDELVEVVDATVTLECAIGMIASEAEVVLHNAGNVDIQVVPSIYWYYDLVGPGGETVNCGGYYCEEGDAICEAEPAAIPPGEASPWTQIYPASDCSQELTAKETCALCGGTASINIPWEVDGPGGFGSFQAIAIEGVTIDCI